MQLSYNTIRAILDRELDHYEDTYEYGEPGYTFPYGAETPMIVLGSYWCRCDKSAELHGQDFHHPRVWAQLESQGVQLEWHDEWAIDPEYGKAYRTQPDSYTWQPSYVLTEHCDMITADDDPETIIEWATDDPGARCIPRTIMPNPEATLTAAGFTLHNDRQESGWHQGMNANPRTIMRDLAETVAPIDQLDIVFTLTETSQFHITFATYYRHTDQKD